jgi:hypothetical protein
LIVEVSSSAVNGALRRDSWAGVSVGRVMESKKEEQAEGEKKGAAHSVVKY